MKSLKIDKNFTKDYLSHLDSFISSMQPHCGMYNCHENSMSMAFSKLRGQVSVVARQLKAGKKVTQDISIAPNIILEIQNSLINKKGPKLYACIGGHIEIEDSLLVNQSISLIILCDLPKDINAEDATSWNCPEYPAGAHVLRKFHFDVDKSKTGDWPISHLQYGGSDNSHYVEFNKAIRYQLFSPIDTPRIPHPPYSFIICLDVILKGFKTDASRVTQEKFWILKVKESEDSWLKPFYENVLAHLQTNSRQGTLWDYFSKLA